MVDLTRYGVATKGDMVGAVGGEDRMEAELDPGLEYVNSVSPGDCLYIVNNPMFELDVLGIRGGLGCICRHSEMRLKEHTSPCGVFWCLGESREPQDLPDTVLDDTTLFC